MTAPVLLIHGDRDRATPPEHSQRVFAALSQLKELVLIPGTGHNQSLNDPSIWSAVEEWIDDTLAQQD
ncbi:MAG: alpha/beta hydrolase [Cyanobacteria bacterium J06636_16]